MREILFRAKTASTNPEWVEGYYSKTDTYGATGHAPSTPMIADEDGFWVEINPDTLGQFTGIYDKNGVKIFEGDIIKHYDDIGKVYWDEDVGSFYIRDYNTGLPDNLVLPCALHSSCTYEVIGNIYDNPELLEEE